MPKTTSKPYTPGRPIGDKVLVQADEMVKVTAGGIVVPENTVALKPHRGTVIAVGDGILSLDGTLIPLNIRPGDRVVFAPCGGVAFQAQDEKEYILVRENEILMVITEREE